MKKLLALLVGTMMLGAGRGKADQAFTVRVGETQLRKSRIGVESETQYSRTAQCGLFTDDQPSGEVGSCVIEGVFTFPDGQTTKVFKDSIFVEEASTVYAWCYSKTEAEPTFKVVGVHYMPGIRARLKQN